MDDLAKVAVPKRKPHKAHEATVTGRRQIPPDLVRLSMNSSAFVGKELEFTDHYIKLLLVSEDADYPWPFGIAQICAEQSRDKLPITHAHTLINLDSETGDFDVDLIIHGDSSLAGPWARVAKVGDKLGFLGPGSAWGSAVEHEHFVLAGDEPAAPAIGVSLKHFPESTTTIAYIEIEAKDRKSELPAREGAEIHWVFYNGATHGTELSYTVREVGISEGKRASWFTYDVAEMTKELRRFLFVEFGVPKKDASISGYWRIGMAEDQW